MWPVQSRPFLERNHASVSQGDRRRSALLVVLRPRRFACFGGTGADALDWVPGSGEGELLSFAGAANCCAQTARKVRTAGSTWRFAEASGWPRACNRRTPSPPTCRRRVRRCVSALGRRVLDPAAIVLVPFRHGKSPQPVRVRRRAAVQGSPQGLRHEFQLVEHARPPAHGSNSCAAAPGSKQVMDPARFDQAFQQAHLGTTGEQAIPELAQDAEVEAGVTCPAYLPPLGTGVRPMAGRTG